MGVVGAYAPMAWNSPSTLHRATRWALQLVDAHFASHVAGLGYLVELAHPATHTLLEAEPDLALYGPVELVFQAFEGDAASYPAEEPEHDELLGLAAWIRGS